MKNRLYALLIFLGSSFLFGVEVNAQNFPSFEESIEIINQKTLSYEAELSSTDASSQSFSKLNKELQSFYVIKENLGHNPDLPFAIMQGVIAYSGNAISEIQYLKNDFQQPEIADWNKSLLEIFSK